MKKKEENNTKYSNVKLPIAIGRWLGILPFSQDKTNTSISKQDMEKITKEFRNVLNDAGIAPSQKLFLSKYGKEKNTFLLQQVNPEKKATVSLRYGDGKDLDDVLILSYEEKGKKYVFDKYTDNQTKKSSLSLQYYTEKNKTNENVYRRKLLPHQADFSLQNKEYSLSLVAYRPDKNPPTSEQDLYVIQNESEVKRYLLNLSFPIDICEVYKKFCEIIHGSPKRSLFRIEIAMKYKEKITDRLVIHEGKIIQATITKNGKTISIDQQGNWSYETDMISIHETAEGIINSHLKSSSIQELEEVVQAREEVEIIKEYVKTMQQPE